MFSYPMMGFGSVAEELLLELVSTCCEGMSIEEGRRGDLFDWSDDGSDERSIGDKQSTINQCHFTISYGMHFCYGRIPYYVWISYMILHSFTIRMNQGRMGID